MSSASTSTSTSTSISASDLPSPSTSLTPTLKPSYPPISPLSTSTLTLSPSLDDIPLEYRTRMLDELQRLSRIPTLEPIPEPSRKRKREDEDSLVMTCIICQDELICGRVYACAHHLACHSCIRADLQSKLVGSVGLELKGSTTCPLCRSDATRIGADFRNVSALPISIQTMISTLRSQRYEHDPDIKKRRCDDDDESIISSLHICPYCEKDMCDPCVLDAHVDKCTKFTLNCPDCQNPFPVSLGFSHHVTTSCTRVRCRALWCSFQGYYTLVQEHAKRHPIESAIRTLELKSRQIRRQLATQHDELAALDRRIREMNEEKNQQETHYATAASSTSSNSTSSSISTSTSNSISSLPSSSIISRFHLLPSTLSASDGLSMMRSILAQRHLHTHLVDDDVNESTSDDTSNQWRVVHTRVGVPTHTLFHQWQTSTNRESANREQEATHTTATTSPTITETYNTSTSTSTSTSTATATATSATTNLVLPPSAAEAAAAAASSSTTTSTSPRPLPSRRRLRQFVSSHSPAGDLSPASTWSTSSSPDIRPQPIQAQLAAADVDVDTSPSGPAHVMSHVSFAPLSPMSLSPPAPDSPVVVHTSSMSSPLAIHADEEMSQHVGQQRERSRSRSRAPTPDPTAGIPWRGTATMQSPISPTASD